MSWQEELKKSLIISKTITKGCFFVSELRPEWIALCVDNHGGWMWASAYDVIFACENYYPFSKDDFFKDSKIKILYRP